ncbi:hypothetical protein HanRHA438_Chr12g0573791 [Helianthus annuus]|nr:hypothetical protein HanRHA438_Chr12g0573791 [Helianthus annuus]
MGHVYFSCAIAFCFWRASFIGIRMPVFLTHIFHKTQIPFIHSHQNLRQLLLPSSSIYHLLTSPLKTLMSSMVLAPYPPLHILQTLDLIPESMVSAPYPPIDGKVKRNHQASTHLDELAQASMVGNFVFMCCIWIYIIEFYVQIK